MNAQEVFEQHGLTFDSNEQAMESLNDLDIVELWDLAEALMPENTGIESTGDEDSDSMILRTALINALENGADSLTQEDFDRAREQVVSLEDEIEADSFRPATPEEDAELEQALADEPEAEEVEAAAEDVEVEVEAAAEVVDQPKRRGRRPSSEAYAIVKSLVADNPELVKDEVVEQAQAQAGVGVSESTLVLYFYRARKELNLGTNGTRGRPRSEKWDQIVELVRASGDADRSSVISEISTQHDVAESTATNYYHKAQREIAGE